MADKTLIATLTGDTFVPAAANWSIIGVSTVLEDASGNFTLNAPAGTPAIGDLLVACISFRSNVAVTPPAGAGWNLVATQQTSGDSDTTSGIASGGMWYKVLTTAADPSFAWTRTAGAVLLGRVLRYRGGNASGIYFNGNAATLGSLGEPSAASIANVPANALIVYMVASGDEFSVGAFDAATDPATASGTNAPQYTGASTAPTVGTWVLRANNTTGTNPDLGLAIADGVKTSLGATGTMSAVDATGQTRSASIVAVFNVGTPFNDARQAAINGIDSAQSEAHGWDVEKANIPVAALVRTSNTVVTLTIPSLPNYDITAQEVLTWTIPASILIGGVAVVATPTVTIDPAAGAYELIAAAGSFSETGTAAGLKATRKMVAGTTSYSESGTAVLLKRNSKTVAGTAAFSLAGTAVAMRATHNPLAAAAGVFSLAGTAAFLKATRRIAVGAGVFDLVGTSVDLVYVPVGLAYELIAAAGSFSLAGTDAELLAARILSAGAGPFSLAGVDVELVYTPIGAFVLISESAAFDLDGTVAFMMKDSRLSSTPGSYVWDGHSVSLSYSGVPAGAAGDYELMFRRRRR